MLESWRGRLVSQVRSAPDGEDIPLSWMDDVIRYAFSRVGALEDAQDIAMEIWQEATKRRELILSKESPRAFLIGMARRRIVDVARKRKRDQAIRAQPPRLAEKFDPHRMEISEVLDALSPEHREVLVLKYVHEFTQEEISEIIQLSPEAVNSLLQRARHAFRLHGAHLLE